MRLEHLLSGAGAPPRPPGPGHLPKGTEPSLLLSDSVVTPYNRDAPRKHNGGRAAAQWGGTDARSLLAQLVRAEAKERRRIKREKRLAEKNM